MSASGSDEDQDGESPGGPQRDFFEQERTKIAPEVMTGLRAKLLLDPHGIVGCQHEKWRRGKISPCQEAIANTRS